MLEPCHNRATAEAFTREANRIDASIMAGDIPDSGAFWRYGYRGDQWAAGSVETLQLAGYVVCENPN